MNCIWEMNDKYSDEIPMGHYIIPNNRSNNAKKCYKCIPDCEEVKYHIQAVQKNRQKSRNGVFGDARVRIK